MFFLELFFINFSILINPIIPFTIENKREKHKFIIFVYSVNAFLIFMGSVMMNDSIIGYYLLLFFFLYFVIPNLVYALIKRTKQYYRRVFSNLFFIFIITTILILVRWILSKSFFIDGSKWQFIIFNNVNVIDIVFLALFAPIIIFLVFALIIYSFWTLIFKLYFRIKVYKKLRNFNPKECFSLQQKYGNHKFYLDQEKNILIASYIVLNLKPTFLLEYINIKDVRSIRCLLNGLEFFNFTQDIKLKRIKGYQSENNLLIKINTIDKDIYLTLIKENFIDMNKTEKKPHQDHIIEFINKIHDALRFDIYDIQKDF